MGKRFLFFNDTATTEIYTYWHTLSLHDALPILLELPSRGEEAWRWSRLDALPELAHARHGEAGNAAQHFIGLGGPRLVFVDGVLDEDASELGRVSIGALDLATDHPLGRQATGAGWALTLDRGQEIGRASWRGRGCKYG